MTSLEDQVKAIPAVQIDNDRVRVTRWIFAPGAHTGRHVHELAYVVVPLTDGTLDLTAADGRQSTGELQAGGSYYRSAGMDHDVTNAGPNEIVFIEIEMKAHPWA